MKGKKCAAGGSVGLKTFYAGADSHVADEAEEKKKGGRVKKAAGGAITTGKDLGSISGGKSRLNLGRPGRKVGGRVGATTAPLSSAAGSTNAPGRTASETGG